MHLTGGPNSVKNSYIQYGELGARTRAMLLAAAAQQWNVPSESLKAQNGVVSGGGKSAGYGELFDVAMQQPIAEKVSRAKSTGQQIYGVDIKLPGLLVAVIAHPPNFGAKFKIFAVTAAEKVKGVRVVLPVDLDRGGNPAQMRNFRAIFPSWRVRQKKSTLSLSFRNSTTRDGAAGLHRRLEVCWLRVVLRIPNARH